MEKLNGNGNNLSDALYLIKNLVEIANFDGEPTALQKKYIYRKGLKFGFTTEEIDEIIQNPENIEKSIPETIYDRYLYLISMLTIALINAKLSREKFYFLTEKAKEYGFDNKELILELLDNLAKYFLEEDVDIIKIFIEIGKKYDILPKNISYDDLKTFSEN